MDEKNLGKKFALALNEILFFLTNYDLIIELYGI